MTYAKQDWTDHQTVVDAAHMEHIEDGIVAIDNGGTSVLAYEAVGDGVADDTAAIQAALNAAAPGGGLVSIPVGTYKTTVTLTVPEGVSVVGAGAGTVIQAHGCDAFTFPISNFVGGVRFSDMQIQGVNSTEFAAIRVPGGPVANGSQRTTGITFDTLLIFNFGYGFRLRGLWRSCIRECSVLNVYYGIYCVGQNCVLDIHGNRFEKSVPPGTPSGATNSIGFLVDSAFDYDPGGTSEARPENIRVHENQFFGFDIGIYNKRALLASYDQNDCDYSAVHGIRYLQSDNTLQITNNWVAINGPTAQYGIYAEPVDPAISHNPVRIELNSISVAESAMPSVVGIYLGNNQSHVRIRDNSIRAFPGGDIVQAGGNTDVVSDGNVVIAAIGATRSS